MHFYFKQDLFGVLQLTAVSSGYAVGSCNWLIQSEYEKVRAYVGRLTVYSANGMIVHH